MNSFSNKKKINFIPSKKIIKFFVLFFVLLFLLYFFYNELKNKNKFINLIQQFSQRFDYELKVYEVNTLYRTNKIEVSNIINKYLDQSIFLIPLNVISDSLINLRWVKNVNLSTNLKNKINIEIFEFKPIGLFSFNDKFFYFSKEGQIIDEYRENINERLILFHGKHALKNASKFLKILYNIKQPQIFKIKEAYYINERRWNVKLAQ